MVFFFVLFSTVCCDFFQLGSLPSCHSLARRFRLSGIDQRLYFAQAPAVSVRHVAVERVPSARESVEWKVVGRGGGGTPGLSIDSSIGLSIDPSIGLSIDPAIGLSIDPSVGLSIDPAIGLSIDPSIGL